MFSLLNYNRETPSCRIFGALKKITWSNWGILLSIFCRQARLQIFALVGTWKKSRTPLGRLTWDVCTFLSGCFYTQTASFVGSTKLVSGSLARSFSCSCECLKCRILLFQFQTFPNITGRGYVLPGSAKEGSVQRVPWRVPIAALEEGERGV